MAVNQLQIGDFFQFPLAMDVYVNGKHTRQNVWVDAKAKNEFTFSVAKNPELINLNADGILLGEISETKTPEQYLLQYQGSKEFLSKWKAVQDAAKNAATSEVALKTLVVALKDTNYPLRIEALKGLELSKPNQVKLASPRLLKLPAPIIAANQKRQYPKLPKHDSLGCCNQNHYIFFF